MIDRAIAMAQNMKEQWCEAELCRTKGELVLTSRGADVATAEAHFERALGIARQQHAKSWELRAATSMARLWRDQDKADEARDLLAPVYNWFTEGFDTVDLKEASMRSRHKPSHTLRLPVLAPKLMVKSHHAMSAFLGIVLQTRKCLLNEIFAKVSSSLASSG